MSLLLWYTLCVPKKTADVCVHDYKTVVVVGTQMIRGVSSYCVNAFIWNKYRDDLILALI